MVNKKLKQYATEKNWTINKNAVYGEVKGYLFTIYDCSGFKLFCTPLAAIDESMKSDILAYLKENKKRLKIFESKFDNDVLALKIKENFKSVSFETIDNLLNSVTSYLVSKNIISNNCIFCGKSDAFSNAYIDGICYKVHDQCYNDATKEIQEAMKEYNAEDKNYFLGFLGALIGGIVCTIPWILVQVFANRIAAVLAYLIGLGSYKSYSLFKGKLGPFTRWIVSFCTIVSVIVAQVGIVIAELIHNNIPVTYENWQLLKLDADFMRVFRGNLIMGLFMAFLGILPLFLQLKGDAKSVMPKIEKNLKG